MNRTSNKSKLINMKVRFYLLMLFVFHFGISSAQTVTIQMVQPGNYSLTFEKVTSYSIFSSKAYNVVAKITINDNQGPVAELNSIPFDLVVGTSRFEFASKAKNIEYLDKSFEEYYKSVGNFPPGVYEICITILCPTPPMCENSIGEEHIFLCQEVEVIEPTPLILTNPSDGEKLNHILPFFQWIPPMPISNRIPLQYRMKLVKLEEGQSGEDAMYRNRPIFQSEMLDVPSHQYLSSYYTLEKGQKYAWMVDAYAKGKFLTNSEVWEFEIVPDLIFNEAYLLKTNSDNGTLAWNKSRIKLGFETNYPLNTGAVNKVTSYQNNQILTSYGLDVQNIHLGKNIIELDLYQLGFIETGVYFIEIDLGSEKYSINISYKSEN